MPRGEPILYSLYIYAPNKVAPIIFAALFTMSAGFYVWQCIIYKCFKLTWLHLVSAYLFALGYALREYGAFNYLYNPDDDTSLILFVLSQVFIYVCPPLLELANYHVLGRIFYYVPAHAPIPAGRVLAIFGGLMAIVELLNGLGVSLASNPSSEPSQQSLGKSLTLAALSMQLLVIFSFVLLAGAFHRSCHAARLDSSGVMSLLFALYASMTLILLRCIYRLVEYVEPTSKDLGDIDALRKLSPLIRYEAFFYVFEAAAMFANSVLWNIWNPGRFLPYEYHLYLGADGAERVGQPEIDARPIWAKVAHILTFGIFYGRKHGNPEASELVEHPNA